MSEDKPTDIVVVKRIDSPIDRVWEALITPEDITSYHHADEDWTTPYARADARPKGKLSIGFASADGKNNFDFEATFVELSKPTKVSYRIADGRLVTYTLQKIEGNTELTLSFTPEDINPREKQQEGWSQIMNHLAQYLEGDDN